MSRRGGEPMGLRKHGTGQIVSTDEEQQEQQDLTTTASADWSEQDEQALADEDKE